MLKNFNSVQLLFACCTLEQEFEIETWKKVWFNATGNAYKNCQVQPDLTRWEHVSESCVQFSSRADGLMKVSKHVIIKKASTFESKQVEITTDMHEMASNDVLVAMCHFVAACHKSFWQPTLIMLKGVD